MKPHDTIAVLKATYQTWSNHRASRMGAALAYYTVFSLAPLLVVIIAIVGLVYGPRAVQGQLEGQISGLVGSQSALLIQGMVASASRRSSGIIAAVLGVATLVLGASGLFGELQSSLDSLWGIVPKPRGILATVKARLLAFAMVVVISALLLASLVITTVLAAAGSYLASRLPVPPVVLQAANYIVAFVIVIALFALIFKLLPDAVVSWRDAFIGGAFTAVLFAIGQLALGLYLGRNGTASAYGAAGALVVLLLWVYYASQILFFGAAFTQVSADRYGHGIQPAPDATRLPESAPTARPAATPEGRGSAPEAAPTGPHPAKRPQTTSPPVPAGATSAGAMASHRRSWVAGFIVALVVGIGITIVEVIRSVAEAGGNTGLPSPGGKDPA
jgi:membrane protein